MSERVVATVHDGEDARFILRCQTCTLPGVYTAEPHPLDLAARWGRDHAIQTGHAVDVVEVEVQA